MKSIAIGIAALASTALLLAQTPAPAQRPSAPLFRTGVDYVSVDVIVTDKNDKPVEDLRQDEFIVTENKKVQTIRDFQHISKPVAHRVIDVKAVPEPEPDVVTNTAPTPSSRLFALVIDDLHILESEIVTLKGVMADFLKALSPDDEVAVVFVGHSNLGQNFTTSTTRVLAAIDHVRGALGFGLDAMAVHESGLDLAGVTVEQPLPGGAAGVLSSARSAAFTLKNVAMSLAGSGHSRRVIVYVSGGSPLDPNADPHSGEYFAYKTFKDEMLDAFDQARRADVPIYTLDPRGIVTNDQAVRGFVKDDGETRRRITIQQDYLATFAINTGGRALINRSNMTKAVDEIVAENGSYYLLGYSPDTAVHDGKYHPIDVKVTRPGLIVRPRAGYVAPATGPASTDARPALDKAMSAGVNTSGLALRAIAAPVAAGQSGMTTVVTLQVTYPTPSDGSQRVDDTLQMSIIALDPDGKVKASSSRALQFSSVVPENGAPLTFLVNDTIALPSQALTLRVGIASQSLDKAGTIQFPLDVVKASDSKLQWGGVAIGFADFLREAALRGDAIHAFIPFQPTTARTFAAADTLRIFGRLFWGSKDAASDVTLSLDGAPGRPSQAIQVPAAKGDSSHHDGTLAALVPLKGLAPGAYTLRLAAHLANGQTADRLIPLEIR